MTGLEESEHARLLERAIDSSIDGMAILGEDGTFRYANQSHADIYGYDAKDNLVGETWKRLYDDEERERFETEVMPELRDTGEWRGQAIGKRQDGETFLQELSLTRMEGGEIICVVRDISQRKERKETLEQYEEVLKSIRDGVYTLDANGQITWVNQTAVEEFNVGYDREELVGSSVGKVLNRTDIEKCLSIIQELLESDTKESGRCEVELQTAYGTEIPCELHLTLLRDSDGTFQGTVGVVRDITERKQREQRLSVLNRVLRHNLRNDLSVIIGQAEWLATHLDGTTAEKAETIHETAKRLTALGDKARTIENTLQRDASSQLSVDVVEIVESRCDVFRANYPDASITTETPAQQEVMADETVETVVDNLVENALEHAEDSPRVSITVSSPPADSKWVTIRVSDNGPGIPREEIEPLHTGAETPMSHGTGLGLWVVSWLVDSYGGELTFEETTAAGSTVVVKLREGVAEG